MKRRPVKSRVSVKLRSGRVTCLRTWTHAWSRSAQWPDGAAVPHGFAWALLSVQEGTWFPWRLEALARAAPSFRSGETALGPSRVARHSDRALVSRVAV